MPDVPVSLHPGGKPAHRELKTPRNSDTCPAPQDCPGAAPPGATPTLPGMANPALPAGLGISHVMPAVLLLLGGVKESKSVTNFFSTLNVSLVFFMATFSLTLVKKENMIPFIPKEFGAGGVLRGATSSFFGYIGFDEICCMSGESINPSKNIPRAIIITLLVVTTLYCAASIGLAGMVPYQDISETSGFPDGLVLDIVVILWLLR